MWRRALVAVLVAGAALAGVLALRAELMTVDVPQPEGSYTDVRVVSETREEEAVLREMTHGLISTCRLLVNADVVEQSFVEHSPGVFSFRLRPGLDEFDRRELRGCLSDTRVQHLRVAVERLQTISPGGNSRG